jgi:transcriptional regulator with XRE-family HTH domain
MADRPRSELLVAFGAAVRALRRDRGLSQEEFADRVGLHRTYIGDVERGERNIGLVNIGRIAVGLDVPLSVLMAETERPSTDKPQESGSA